MTSSNSGSTVSLEFKNVVTSGSRSAFRQNMTCSNSDSIVSEFGNVLSGRRGGVPALESRLTCRQNITSANSGSIIASESGLASGETETVCCFGILVG